MQTSSAGLCAHIVQVYGGGVNASAQGDSQAKEARNGMA